MREKCDVLVIGSGMAGIRASIEAHDCGANVILVSKGKAGIGGASFPPNSLPWGIMTAGKGVNADDVFYNEIMGASNGAIDVSLVEVMVRDSNARYNDLCQYGIKLNRLDEENRIPCFGSKPRGAQLNDYGNLQACLKKQIQKRGIHVVEHVTILELMVKDAKCFGAIGLVDKNQFVVFEAGAVILATGGAEDLWKYNIVTPDIAGDGYAMALRNGASLTNMEFIQFIPATVNTPMPLNFHTLSLASVPKVLNDRKEEILKKYLPDDVSVEECLKARATHGPFSNEDVSRYFDIGLYSETKNQDIGVEIEYGASFYEKGKYERWKDILEDKGVDINSTNLRLYPHCQGFNGGIVINRDGRTEIEDLFACGECAGGPHGANRMGGNAILATQVFGKIAGEKAAASALNQKNRHSIDVDYNAVLRDKFDTGYECKLQPEEISSSIKQIMHKNAAIMRNAAGLSLAVGQISRMRHAFNPYQRIEYGLNVHQSVEAYNALLTAQAVLYLMLKRKESRGSHYRTDYPIKKNTCNTMHRVRLSDLPIGAGNE